jgi:hypothetical protein
LFPKNYFGYNVTFPAKFALLQTCEVMRLIPSSVRLGIPMYRLHSSRAIPEDNALPIARSSLVVRHGAVSQARKVLYDAGCKLNANPAKSSRPITIDENYPPKQDFERLGDPDEPRDCYEFDLEIFRFMLSAERESLPSPNMFDRQTNITPRMRAMVLDWLVEVHRKMKMRTDTLYLTIRLIDQYLTATDLDKSRLQRLACAALLIAAKSGEIYPPTINDLVLLADKSFSGIALSRMEASLLAVVHFHVDLILPSMFLKRFLRLVNPDDKLSMLAYFILEASLMDQEFVGILPSKVAAGATCLAVTLERGCGSWGPREEANSGYSVSELIPVVQKLLQSVTTLTTGRFHAIRKKYATPSMYKVSGMSYPETIRIK